MRRHLFAIFLLTVCVCLAWSQHPDNNVAEGARLFAQNCSACHGDTGKGGRGSDLTSGQWKHGSTDDDIARNIIKGIPGTQMPAFPLSEAEARKIVAFLRTLSGSAKSDVATGNLSAGRQLFFGAAQCSTCHMFGGRGEILGTDLTDVRARHRLPELARRMQAPIKWVEARLASGAAVRGIRKNEDTFTLHLLDAERKWHLLNKRDITLKTSEQPHPRLTAQQRNDVLAFLTQAPPTYEPPAEWKPAADFNVTFARLNQAQAEPQNWLTYWGDLRGRHYSGLRQITPQNVAALKSVWTAQLGGTTVETTPLVVDGMMFVTGPLNTVTALDARTGQMIWKYTRRLPQVASHCTVMTNRGLAVLGDRLFLATLDMHLIALDAKSGNIIWDVEQDDYRKGLSNTHAPLAIDGKIIVGVTAGECALTGYVDAFDAATGKKLWRTFTTPQPGDPNRKTWEPESAADFGGAPTWMTGTYDSETKTIFWTTGNPGPDYDGTVRGGDNLYSCSVVALDEATGKMKWWFQFTPHDVHDWDGTQTPMLIDGVIKGRQRKLLVTAQRNAFYYVLDRETGEFLQGQAFAKQTWAKGLDAKGRPIVLPNTTPTPQGNHVCPDAAGAANWGSPSYDPATGFFLVSVREACATYTSVTKSPVPGQGYTGGGVEVDANGAPGSVRALDALTGAVKWNFPLHIGASSTGVLATAGGVVFASSNDGNLIALDHRTGKYLWHYYTGAPIVASPMAYAVGGRQYVAIASQSAIIVFALPTPR
ncbi:MAG TPA: PQQ-dependent dehydrogenase, methanol/ethanol family [Blastocatellia bacterium]|nr:PQQ-dependent dehydrogenase, methanol/ethanol family [Blastocatellia bacterium]